MCMKSITALLLGLLSHSLCAFAFTARSPLGVSRGDYDLELFSPAKVNLFLRIIRKREDGYHELASLFQTIGFGDTLLFKNLGPEATADEFSSSFTALLTDKSNLVTRSLDLFRQKTGIKDRFKVYLDKKTPVQAGLGGGSSNAATTLFAANQMTGRPALDSDLIEWSKELGSDITFFLSRGTAYCTGRGEIIDPIEPLPTVPILVVKPPMGLSTPLVFKSLDYSELSQRDPKELLTSFANALTSGKSMQLADFVNDLEPPAFRCVPELKDLKDKLLEAGFQAAMMSGSGTSLFAMYPPEGLDLDDFGARFAAENRVAAYPSVFCSRPVDPNAWYPSTS